MCDGDDDDDGGQKGVLGTNWGRDSHNLYTNVSWF